MSNEIEGGRKQRIPQILKLSFSVAADAPTMKSLLPRSKRNTEVHVFYDSIYAFKNGL